MRSFIAPLPSTWISYSERCGYKFTWLENFPMCFTTGDQEWWPSVFVDLNNIN